MLEEKLKCPYKILSENKDSTTFANPNKKLQNCYNCDGFGMYEYNGVKLFCDFYESYIKYKRMKEERS